MVKEKIQLSDRVDILDYARLLAATAVMLYHFTFLGIVSDQISSLTLFPYLSDVSRYGYLGVELFFMISGYVIFYSAKNSTASKFVVARLLRLYPAFICALLITSAAIILWGMPKFKVYPSQFLSNFTMIPSAFGRHPVDGSYWTLALEIQFYGLIFAILLCGFGRRLETFFLSWPVLIFLASFVGGKDWPLFGGYYSYFAAGALFAMKRAKSDWKINTLIVLCLYLSLSFSAGSHISENVLAGPSPVIISGLISVFYLFFFALNFEKVLSISLPKAYFAGAITYPLYLIHQVIGCIIISRFGNDQNKFSILMSAVLLSLALAFFLHRYAERSLKSFWKNFFDRAVGAPIRGIEFQILRIKDKSEAIN